MISYSQAAARCDAATYSVEVTLPCPQCGCDVSCTVYGADEVVVGKCVDPECSHWSSRTRHLTERAIGRAECERADVLDYLRSGGR